MSTTGIVTSDQDIQYNHTNRVSGFVGGDCNAYWGGATVKAYSAAVPTCLLGSTMTDNNGNYSFDVSAHDIILAVEDFDPTSGPRANDGVLLAIEYEVALDSTTVVDIIFRTPITVEVSGFPNLVCNDIADPILDQYRGIYADIYSRAGRWLSSRYRLCIYPR